MLIEREVARLEVKDVKFKAPPLTLKDQVMSNTELADAGAGVRDGEGVMERV